MPEQLLEVRGLKKYFAVGGSPLGRRRGWVKAVDGVSFTIDQGQTLGLVGESGCGKTTTSKLILAAEQPTAGTIAFAGRNLAQLDSKGLMDYRRQVQVVFQDPYSSLSPRMRVWDIIGERRTPGPVRCKQQLLRPRSQLRKLFRKRQLNDRRSLLPPQPASQHSVNLDSCFRSPP